MDKKPRRTFIASVVGTILVALCCFTPILVVTLTTASLGFFIPYLDFVLFPTLFVFIILTIVSYRRWRNSDCSK